MSQSSALFAAFLVLALILVAVPAGTAPSWTRAVDGRFGNDEDTFSSFAVPRSALVEGTNTIAVEVHQNTAASSDLASRVEGNSGLACNASWSTRPTPTC